MPALSVTEAEYLDVVDEYDRVVDRLPRQTVHARQLRHRAVHILVFNGSGELFLQRRSWRKEVAPGLWDSSAAGHLDCGEAYDTAAVRELAEELGVHAEPQRFLHLEAAALTGWEFVWVYRCVHAGPFTLAADEIDEGRWYAPRELDATLAAQPARFSSTFATIWTTLRNGVDGHPR